MFAIMVNPSNPLTLGLSDVVVTVPQDYPWLLRSDANRRYGLLWLEQESNL
jgi:hypothetical protein